MNVAQTEPVLTAAAVAGAIIAIAAIFGVVLDTNTVETIVAALLPVLLAVIARRAVTPTVKSQ
jgi:membrane protein implicated in regulation of membrane protease activity